MTGWRRALVWFWRGLLVWFSISAAYSAWEGVRHLLDGDGVHALAHLLIGCLYAIGSIALLALLYPQVECEQCHGDGFRYTYGHGPQAHQCFACHGKGTRTGRA